MNDLEQRQTEIESLAAIFPDLLFSQTERQLIFKFEKDITLNIILPNDYPSTCPPIFELGGPYLQSDERKKLHDLMNETYIENLGFPIIFNWISIIQEFIQDLKEIESCSKSVTNEIPMEIKHELEEDLSTINIQSGEVLSDRKSFFQAHLAKISSKEEVEKVMKILKSNSKIRRATHNILAYRYSMVKDGKEIKYHDCEDDGETGASSKMLELMERMNANNVMVVVSRWYGGIHLGPDRFRHINNLTRQILVENNYGTKRNN